MSHVAPDSTAPDRLEDPWDARAVVPLDGPLERHRWPPLLTVLVALIGGLVLFQGISGVAAVVFMMAAGLDLNRMVEDLPTLLEERAGLFLMANTVGQVLGLAVLAYILARLHSSKPGAFLRLRVPDLVMLALAFVGLLSLLPVVQWAGSLNETLPLPEWLRELEESQMELIERVLQSELSVLFNLLMLAVVPALCEELLFRGYVQRQAERGLGAAGGILLSGLVFGAYHLRLTQLLPLSLLGLYLAYVAWRTGSLWIPILLHFANNAVAVVAAAFIKADPDMDISDLESMEVPWFAVAAGIIIFAVTVYAMHRWATVRQVRRSDEPASSFAINPESTS